MSSNQKETLHFVVICDIRMLASLSKSVNYVVEWVSSICVSRSGGGGGLRSLCIKIGYSEPSRVESRELRGDFGPS